MVYSEIKAIFFLQFDGDRIVLNTNEFLQEKQQSKVMTSQLLHMEHAC